MKRILATGILFLAAIIAFGQQGDSLFIKRISDEILLHGQAYDNLRVLTKTIGGRLAGSPQMVKAETWGLKTLQQSGAGKAWLQECLVPHWVRGGRDEVLCTWEGKKKALDVIALGNSLGSGPKGVKGDVIEVKSFDELEKRKDEIKGKIVFYNYPFINTLINTFQAYSDAVKYRGDGASRAAKYGAVAVIVRSMSNSTDNIPHTGSMHYDSAYAMIPAVAVGLQDADWLSKNLSTTRITALLKTYGKFLPDTIGHNVIGEIKGSEFPDEYITIGGHLDSWDPAEGAHDDGAGIVQTIEVLRTFQALGYKPRHSIRFVLFANEENGTRGGMKYAEEAKANNEKHILALESDEGGFTPRGFGISGTEAQYQKVAAWSALLTPYGGGEIVRGGGGSDISYLKDLGTPQSGFRPDPQRYFDIHHARNDVFENVNKRELELGAVNMTAFVYLVDKYGL